MGVVQKRGNWWLDYRYNGRRYRKKVGPSKSVAKAAWAKIQIEIAENKFLDIKKEQRIKLEDFADEYFELHCKVNHRSPESAAGSQIKVLKRYFPGKYLHEITPIEIEKFKAERVKEVSPATVNRALTCLKAIFNKAIKWRKFDGSNPVKEVKFFKEENHKLNYLEVEEIRRLILASQGAIKPVVIVALNTGMRRGEILNLKWQDIDFKQGIIELLKTKSGKKRMIPMNEDVKNILISVRKNPNSPYIFCNRNGEPLKDVRTAFATALRRAGVKRIRFHDLRHTFASQLVMSGADLNTVRELLGHSDLKTTLIYAHLSKDHKTRAVNALCQKISCPPISRQSVNTSLVESLL